jgi:hypothetical protein
LVDQQRPAGAPSRLAAFFLTDDPAHNEALGAMSSRYYRVEPVGVSLRVDYDWLMHAKELFLESRQARHLGTRERRELTELVDRYWSGRKSSSFRAWEWIAPRIYVCSELTSIERQRAMKAGERRWGFPVIAERLLREALRKDARYQRERARTQSRADRDSAPPPERREPRKPTPPPVEVKRALRSADTDLDRALRRLQGIAPKKGKRR